MNCNYCVCKECALYEECEPCRGDYDYEHPCEGYCDDFEQMQKEGEGIWL